MGKIKITINGREYFANPSDTILKVAWENGINIPVFCYHPNLPIIAACRMCLVEVKIRDRFELKPACATTVMENMEILTDSENTKKAREDILSQILSNHPLECPVCDAGGECDLQNIVFEHGPTKSNYEFQKWIKEKTYAGPYLEVYPNRCIICYRCVSFYNSIETDGEWGFLNRGKNIIVGPTGANAELKNPFIGNMIEICPLGAITGKDYRFKSRPWEHHVINTVSPHDSFGQNVKVYVRIGTRYGRGPMLKGGVRKENFEIIRINLRANQDINNPWIDDRARFAHSFIKSQKRFFTPFIREDNKLLDISYGDVVDVLIDKLERIKNKYGPNSIGLISGGIGTNESAALMERILRGYFGTPHLDSRPLNPIRFPKDPILELLGASSSTIDLADIPLQDVLVILDVEIENKFPLLGLNLLKQKKYGLSFLLTTKPNKRDEKYVRKYLTFSPRELKEYIFSTLEFILNQNYREEKDDLLSTLTQSPGSICFVIDDSSDDDLIHNVLTLSNLVNAKVLVLRTFPNTQGLIDQGIHPNLTQGQIPSLENGYSAWDMLKKINENEIKALIFWNINPLVEFPDSQWIKDTIKNLELIVTFDSFFTEIAQESHISIPIATPFEEEGTVTSTCGILQPQRRVLNPPYNLKTMTEFLLMLYDKVFGSMPNPSEIVTTNNPLYKNIYPPKESVIYDRYPQYIPTLNNLTHVYRYPKVTYPNNQKLKPPIQPIDNPLQFLGFPVIFLSHLYYTHLTAFEEVNHHQPEFDVVIHPETLSKIEKDTAFSDLTVKIDKSFPKNCVGVIFPNYKKQAVQKHIKFSAKIPKEE